MRKQLSLIFILLCLAILGPSRPGLADSFSPIPADLLDHLLKEGWTEVSPGVMQRSLGGHRVETLGFGAAGLRFQIAEMKAHLSLLRKDYARQPSRQLRKAIRSQRAQILRLEEALRATRKADEELEIATEPLIESTGNCLANYDASALAFPLAQGVSASARAYFNNPCGDSGGVYAYAYATARDTNGVVTNRTKDDPAPSSTRDGADVSASASVSVDGVSECYSFARATVLNYGFGITHDLSEANYECAATLPAPWMKTDVGAVGLAGSASYNAQNGQLELIAGGTDLAGTADAFHFVHQTLSGDGEIVANVSALLKPAGANRTLAGVTFRNDLTAGSPHATMTITSEGEAKFRRRTTAGGSTLSDGFGAGTTFAPQWLKLVRSGNVFTAYLSSNRINWTQVHTPQTVPLSTTVYVGLVALRNGSTAPTGAVRFERVDFGTVLTQDFQSSTSVASYFNATAPNRGQFNDIKAEAEGGTLSIQGGRFQLVRTGSTSTENDAWLHRFTDFPGPPSFLHVSFDIGASAWTLSQYQSGAFQLMVGRYGPNDGNIASNLFQTVEVKGEGPGRYSILLSGVKSAFFNTDGALHHVELFLNKSAWATTYRAPGAPDGTVQTLRSNGAALWVDSVPVVTDAAAVNGSTSTLTDLRMQWSSGENATWTIDNIEVRAFLPPTQ